MCRGVLAKSSPWLGGVEEPPSGAASHPQDGVWPRLSLLDFPKWGIFRVEGSATCPEVSLFYPAVVGVFSSPGKGDQSDAAKICLSSCLFVHGYVPLQITRPLLSPAVTHVTGASLNLTAKPLEVI